MIHTALLCFPPALEEQSRLSADVAPKLMPQVSAESGFTGSHGEAQQRELLSPITKPTFSAPTLSPET